ncbi:MAG: hypothetical protein IT290_02430, partial [Deltaproteobacteria bacterium]|nr:hypothetical protein [Deltaproteobacteria bacterium]
PLTPALKTSAGIKAGFLVFSEQDDENRMTLDTALQADSEPMLVPDPFKVSVASRISSTNGRASVAQGTATRQSQVHVGSLTIGVAPQAVMEQTTLDLNYNLSRQDFLGEFLFKNDDEEQDPRFEERGSDFYTNAITASLKRVVNDRLEASFNNAVNYQTFTNSDSSDIDGVPVEEGDLDRLNYRPSLGGSYKLAERSLANASVGMDFTKFQGDQAERTLTVLNPDGTVTTIQRQPDDTQSSLFFSTAVNYFPTQGSSITLSADQSAGTDVDGDRLTMRSFALDAGSQIFESFSVGAGLRYSQFNNGDSLSGATERYEGTVSARYHISQTLALALGYNYAQQKRGDAAEAAFFADGDYETNRVFISLDGGFVGVAS